MTVEQKADAITDLKNLIKKIKSGHIKDYDLSIHPLNNDVSTFTIFGRIISDHYVLNGRS